MAMKKGDDPADFTVAEVTEYLGKVRDPMEVDRVYNAEEDGKSRAGIMNTREDAPEDDEEAPDAPESDDNDEEAQADAPAPEEAAEEPTEVSPLPTASESAWRTDSFGNPLSPLSPVRPYATGQKFYPFEYVDHPTLPNVIVPTEDVYAVIYYAGSKVRGSTLAYPANASMPSTILDSIVEDDEGRYGPNRQKARDAE